MCTICEYDDPCAEWHLGEIWFRSVTLQKKFILPGDIFGQSKWKDKHKVFANCISVRNRTHIAPK